MTYHLTFTFPKEQYSIEKGSNEFSAKDQKGNRFIMTADNKQKGGNVQKSVSNRKKSNKLI